MYNHATQQEYWWVEEGFFGNLWSFQPWDSGPNMHIIIVQSLSHVQLFSTPWTAAHQASRSITNSQSLLIYVHWVSDATQPSHPLLSPSPPSRLRFFPVVMYGCESWTVKKAGCWRIDAFELWCWRRLESPLDCKEIQPVHPKGDQSWVFIRRTDVEAETPILWPPDAKNWLIGKEPDAGKDNNH